MTNKQLYENLCWRDKRFPDKSDTNNLPPRQNCFCDNCFYGRDALARELIESRRLLNKVSDLDGDVSHFLLEQIDNFLGNSDENTMA